MPGITGSARRRHLSAGLIGAVFVALVVVLGSVGAFVVWSGASNDERALQRETGLVAHAIKADLDLLVDNQLAVAYGDKAYAAVTDGFDRGWVDQHLGVSFYEDYGYEQAYVLDGYDQPVYAMRLGHEFRPPRLFGERELFDGLVAELRARIAAGALEDYFYGDAEALPSVADILLVGDQPAEVTIVPIVPETAAEFSTAGPIHLHVLVEYLNADYADFLARQYLLEAASFRTTLSGRPEMAVLPVLNAAGRIITFFEWFPDRPGQRVLRETVPVLGSALALAALLIILLLVRLWRYSVALEAERAQAEHRANHDALTGLANRAHFQAEMDRLLAQGERFALMLLDLDRFKQVNDTLGHPAGDALIEGVGRRLATTIGTDGMLARLGGDEFGVLLPGMQGRRAALELAERMIEAVDRTFALEQGEVTVGLSIGVMLPPDHGESRAELLRKADIALYEAKDAGRNRAVVYEAAMNEVVQKRHAVEAELRRALAARGAPVDGRRGRGSAGSSAA